MVFVEYFGDVIRTLILQSV